MRQRIVYLDIAKAICIILVVIGHYNPDPHPEWWTVVHRVIYSFHMPLFMFASGFLYMATKRTDEDYGSFLWKKVKRLMIPYFAVSVLVISLKLLTESHVYVENPKTVMSYVRVFYLPEVGYFLWFIWALWWMFVLLPLFKSRNQRLFLFFLSIIISYIPFKTTEICCVQQFKQMLVLFMLGVVTFEWRSFFLPLKRVPSAVCLGMFAFASVLQIFELGEGKLD